jgi:uncharacterized protein (DUF488 family)
VFPPVHTIGHSTRSVSGLVDLLRIGEVAMVVDVRNIPRSRTNPQFNLDSLPAALAGYGIGHVRIAELGGLRGRSPTVPPEVNGFWRNRGFHNYADYALSETFDAGLERLLELGVVDRCAIMCAEAVWWRCHRRIIADYLMLRDRTVFHLMDPGRAEPARMTPGAVASGRALTYPATESVAARV